MEKTNTSRRSVLKRCHKHEQADSLRRLTSKKNNLLSWWSKLPDTTTNQDANPQNQLLRPNLHLRLEYCLVRMYVGRPFLFSQHSSTSPSSVVDENGRQSTRVSTRSTLMDDCVQAALEVVDICRKLQDNVGLARASYTEFSSCRSALLVIIAQSLHKKTNRLREALQDGMKMIRVMSAGGDSARSEVSLIEAFERAIARMDAFGEVATRQSPQSESGVSGYDRFKDWEQLWKRDPVAPSTIQNHSAMPSISESSYSQPEIPVANSGASFFGLDNFPYSYPRVLEEFSAIPVFDYDFGAGASGTWGQMDMDQV
jgi:hypothetical protein